jgi:2-succinyl-5-enolpyruvyl-6-hydroxy-3-cyclohexene-1-carboxylic-acid synthase
MLHSENMAAYLTAVINELAAGGVKKVVLSPGSRSTPLAMLLAACPYIHIYLDIDERSAGFLALGMAKAEHHPVALVCTSGTATANYYPAIIEAHYARIPLIVMTADRPHELLRVGAPQTIHQAGMYGDYVKSFAEIEIPEQDTTLIRHDRLICARAIAIAGSRPCGPVHLNVPLRDPLVPRIPEKWPDIRTDFPMVRVTAGVPTLSDEDVNGFAGDLKGIKRGLVICGEPENNDAGETICRLAEKLGFPVLADPLSGLRRMSSRSVKVVIEGYDTFLRDEKTATSFHPELILHFGAVPVSKGLKLWLKQQDCRQVVIDSGSGWRDPEGTARQMIYCDEAWLCRALADRLQEQENKRWMSQWQRINDATQNVLARVRDQRLLDEQQVFAQLSALLPPAINLFIGNSMPIRELDTFLSKDRSPLKVYANRGVNGIDGVVSTAVGVSLVKKNTVLAIGDLSFFHDMNGLLAAKLQHADLTIILINNDGGGIFSFLPQAAEKNHFEALFGTPHGLDFSHAAELYGANYVKVSDKAGFHQALTRAFHQSGLKIIEIPTCRDENVAGHRLLRQRVSEALAEITGDGTDD